jgi:thiamine-phosphate pyrophosphorylase
MKKLEGLYLVLDPKKDETLLLEKLEKSLKAGVNVVQIWNHWDPDLSRAGQIRFCIKVKELAQKSGTPVLINEDWKLGIQADLDGVHFDQVPEDWKKIRSKIDGKLIGITVGNNLDLISWADQNRLSYISFCSVFLSSSVDTCELVQPENIQKARELTRMPIFLSGGINPENLHLLENYSYEGVAVISGVLNSKEPETAVNLYLSKMKKML